MNTPTNQQLVSDAFTRILKSWLSEEEWAEMVQANAEEQDPNICHSHDYVDANEAMLEAFQEVVPDHDFNGILHDEPAVALWNASWDLAKKTWQS